MKYYYDPKLYNIAIAWCYMIQPINMADYTFAKLQSSSGVLFGILQ